MAKWLGQKILALLGSLALVVWWTLTGDDDFDYEEPEMEFSEEALPSVVAGGGRAVTVSLDTSEPITFTATFECDSEGQDPVYVGGQQTLDPGSHDLRFDVNGDCWYGILEAGPSDPPVGATLAWKVHVDGELLQEEDAKLDAPLQPNHGFFVQTGWEDYTLDEVVEYMQAQQG